MVVRRSAVVLVRIAVITLTLLGLLLSLAIPAAQAALTPALPPGPYGSAVPGLATDQLAITQSWPNQIEGGLDGQPAVRSFKPAELGGSLSTIAQVGSVYGLAYHNGESFDPANLTSARTVSEPRLFVGAYGKRLSGFGPSGPGGIYTIDPATGIGKPYFIVPDANNCAGNTLYRDCHSPIDEENAADGPGNPGANVDYDYDWYMAGRVGKTSLGDLEVSPDGRFLYAANLNTNTIQRIRIDGVIAGVGGFPEDKGTISITAPGLPPSGAGLFATRLFGMNFNPTDGSLYVGLVTPNRVTVGGAQVLQAYVVRIADPATGTGQTVVLTQDLDVPGAKENAVIDDRNRDARIKDKTHGWYDWAYGDNDRAKANPVRTPQPMLADIEFSGDGRTMALGFRDRSGDQFFYRTQPANEKSVVAQGDTLVYRGSVSTWTLQTNTGTADVLNDDAFAGNDGTSTIPHAENHIGALARILDGPTGTQPFTYTSRVVLSALDQVQDRTNGVTTYNLQNPGPVFGRVAALQITDPPPLGQSGQGKAAALGDIEPLAAASFVGDRVWKDTNVNGLQDALEPGVAGVLLVLVDAATNRDVATAVTAADGTYTFAVQAGKAYRIRPVLPPELIPTLQDTGSDDALDSDLDTLLKTLPVPPQLRDRTTTTYDLGLIDSTQAIGKIGNFVWDDRDGDGIQDSGEPGLNGVTVSVAWGQP